MLNIDLSFENNEIQAKAKFLLKDDTEDICFSLNKTLKIIKITDEYGNEYIPQCEDISFQFRPELKKYTINSGPGVKEITVEYGGKITNGYHNVISDDCIALNWYSGWYPQKPFNGTNNLFEDTAVNIKNIENYNVIKGTRSGSTWTYKPLDFDVNIIAMKNYEEIRYDFLSLTYLKRCENSLSEKYKEYPGKILDYYRNIYEFDTLPHMDIVILPNTNPYDGYTRKQLIVLGGFCENITWVIKLIAHEIAHIWCTGADVCSWEDWLNETFAEWSALLFIADNVGIPEFEKIINLHRRENLPPIKTADGKRPEKGVHDQGTLMIYELYSLYGKELIIKLLKIYNKLQIKTTSEFLSALRNNNLSAAADYIEKSL